jgi:hypothetical protein
VFACIVDRRAALTRIEFVAAGDRSSLEKMAKKVSKARCNLKSFRNWKPRDSWRCDECLLTGYDRNIQWRICKLCKKNTHMDCQGFSQEEAAAMTDENFQCRPCSGYPSLSQIKQKLLDEVSLLEKKSTAISLEVSSLKQEQSGLKQESMRFMGVTRLKLQEILEKDLSVNRSDYHSSCFVGNHCDIIVERYHEITEVLADHPEVKKKYDQFYLYYKPVHFLMKANRFLTDQKLDKVDFCCEKIGQVYPEFFKASITPKLDDLIFVVPLFARRWRTVGGLREESIEAFHNSSKKFYI